MTFTQARKKLAKIANGKAHSVRFDVLVYGGIKDERTRCNLWIEGMQYYDGPTWDEAFRNLDRAMNGEPVEQMPAVSA